MKGPRPLPTKLKRLRGTPICTTGTEPEPDSTMPAMPQWICQAGRKYWHHYSQERHTLGMLTSIDASAFAAFCDAHGRLEQANLELDKQGLVSKTLRGEQRNPLFSIVKECWTIIRAFSSDLGMRSYCQIWCLGH